MTYTIEEKTAAVERGELWWRFPTSREAYGREWSLLSDDVSQPHDEDLQREDDWTPAEYHIGPTAPVVLNELERELLEALARYVQQDMAHGMTDNNLYRTARAAIAKAKGAAQ